MMDATSVVAQLEVAPAGVPPVALVNTATLLAMLANAGEAVDCAIRKAQGIQAGLDELAANEALSLSQLRANWVAAPAALQFHAARRAQTHAAIEVVFDAADIQVSVLFHCQGNAVVAAATAKRVGLEREAVAADAALEMAIAAKKELQAKVRCGKNSRVQWSTRHTLMMTLALFRLPLRPSTLHNNSTTPQLF